MFYPQDSIPAFKQVVALRVLPSSIPWLRRACLWPTSWATCALVVVVAVVVVACWHENNVVLFCHKSSEHKMIYIYINICCRFFHSWYFLLFPHQLLSHVLITPCGRYMYRKRVTLRNTSQAKHRWIAKRGHNYCNRPFQNRSVYHLKALWSLCIRVHVNQTKPFGLPRLLHATPSFMLRSESVMNAILDEVKPHMSKMKATRDKLQKSVDTAKVSLGRGVS